MCAKRQQPANDPTVPPTYTPQAQDAPDRIRVHYGNLTSSQRQVADYLLAHPFEAATLSIDAMAAECTVSVATMNRFASALGYGSYSSFRNHWQQLLQPGMAPLDKLQQQRDMPSTAHRRLQSTLHNGAAQAQTAAALLDPATTEAMAHHIAKARRIAVLGSDVSAYIAGYFASYASLFRPDVECLPQAGGPSEAQRKLMSLDKDDLLLAISLPRYSSQTLELCALAHARQIPIVVITDRPDAPIAAYTQQILLAPAQHPMLPASAMGVLGLLEGLCTVLAASSPWSAEDMRQRVQLADAFHVDTSPRARAARKAP